MACIARKISYLLMQWGNFPQSVSNKAYFAIHTLLWDVFVLLLGSIGFYLITQNVWCLIAFTVTFGLLRSRAGGIHATNRISCVGMTILLFMLGAYYSSQETISVYISLCSIIASAIILKLGPVENIQKKLSISQLLKNRKNLTAYLLLFETLRFVLKGNTAQISCAIQTAIIIIALMQIAQQIVLNTQFEQADWHNALHHCMTHAVLTVICCICASTTQVVCNRFVYQAHIPEDIQREFDNL